MKKQIHNYLLACILAVFTLLSPLYLSDNYLLCILSLVLIAIIMLGINYNKRDIIFYLAIFISGPLAESIGIQNGLWTYSDPLIFGIPIWLPFVWGNAGLYMLRLLEMIRAIKSET